MKIVGTILLAISILGVASGQSARSKADPFDPSEFHLLDALKYFCTETLPSMEHLNYFSEYFGEFKVALQPICDYVLKEANAPGEFNAMKFCNFVVDYLQLRSTGDDGGPEGPLGNLLNRVVGNVTQSLYGIDINDPTTVCPQAHRFFQPSLWKLLDEYMIAFYTELFSALIPELESICQDWKGYFASLGVPNYSPQQQLVGSLLDIGSEAIGFKNLEHLCRESSKVFSKDWPDRRLFSKIFVLFIRAFILDEPRGASVTLHDLAKDSQMYTNMNTTNLF